MLEAGDGEFCFNKSAGYCHYPVPYIAKSGLLCVDAVHCPPLDSDAGGGHLRYTHKCGSSRRSCEKINCEFGYNSRYCIGHLLLFKINI